MTAFDTFLAAARCSSWRKRARWGVCLQGSMRMVTGSSARRCWENRRRSWNCEDGTVLNPRPAGGDMSTLKRSGLTFVFLWFFLGGVAHFAATDLELSIVPPYVPWPRAAVWMNGVFELLGAVVIGIVWRGGFIWATDGPTESKRVATIPEARTTRTAPPFLIRPTGERSGFWSGWRAAATARLARRIG